MGKASAVMRALQYGYSVVMKREIVEKSNVLSFHNSFRSHPHLWS